MNELWGLTRGHATQDRENPEMMDGQVEGVTFDAHFAKDVIPFKKMDDYPGVDGFVWKVDPLYQINSGQEWLIQVIQFHMSAPLKDI
jgi:hypothetical protein